MGSRVARSSRTIGPLVWKWTPRTLWKSTAGKALPAFLLAHSWRFACSWRRRIGPAFATLTEVSLSWSFLHKLQSSTTLALFCSIFWTANASLSHSVSESFRQVPTKAPHLWTSAIWSSRLRDRARISVPWTYKKLVCGWLQGHLFLYFKQRWRLWQRYFSLFYSLLSF